MENRSKKVPATTNNITLGVINFLNNRGHFAFRVNTTGVWDPTNKFFRQVNKESRGCPDVLACMRWQIAKETHLQGDFIGFEIKNELTNDYVSRDQIQFHKKVKAAGGQIVIVKTYQDFVDWYLNSEYGKPF